MVNTKKITRTSKPPMTTAFCISIQLEFSSTPVTRVQIARQLVPGTNISDPFFIPCDHDFRALRDHGVALRAGAGYAPRARLRINDFSCPAGADRKAETPQHADHFVVGGFKRLLIAHQDARQEQEYDGRAAQARQGRDYQRDAEPEIRVLQQQIPRAAEPCQERGYCAQIEPRRAIAVS